MITLKLKYKSEGIRSLILDYQRQYSNCLHFLYNRISDNPSISEIELRNLYSSINNCSLINKWLFQCAIKEAKQIYKTHGSKVIFGGKLNFINRAKLKISKDEYKLKRLSPIYSIGEARLSGNRLFKLRDNFNIIFQPNRANHYTLQLVGLGNNRIKLLNRLTELSIQNKVTLTYKLSVDYIWITYNENQIEYISSKKIQNRVFAIDINPNYIGWSIIDWNSSSKYKTIKEGVISIKELNAYDNKQKINSTGRIHISNFRKHAILEICKNLVDKAAYYRCDTFAVEDLNFKSTSNYNRKFNRLCRNQWNRNLLFQNIRKRCNIYGIKFVAVKPEYSSFIGNLLFRHTSKAPDMVLSSIEIGRRAYEFKSQYIDKTKNKNKNIVFPNISDFYDLYAKSLEEFSIYEKSFDWIKLYSCFKNTKMTYRVPISDKLVGFRLRSINRFVIQIDTFEINRYI